MFALQWRSMRTKDNRIFIFITFWLHGPLTVWWVPVLGPFTLFSGEHGWTGRPSSTVQWGSLPQAATACWASTPDSCTPNWASAAKTWDFTIPLRSPGNQRPRRLPLLKLCECLERKGGCSHLDFDSRLHYEAPWAPACICVFNLNWVRISKVQKSTTPSTAHLRNTHHHKVFIATRLNLIGLFSSFSSN